MKETTLNYSVETSSLSQYLQELDRHPLLEPGEFDRLIGKAQAGDTDAFNRSRVGEKFGISKERVRQLRNRALSQLQALLSGQDGFAN